MSDPKETKRNHYVPKLYLNRFKDRAKIWTTDHYRGEIRSIRLTSDQAGYRLHLYRQDVEDRFGLQETEVKLLYDKLVRDGRLSTEEFHKWCQFLFGLLVRAPRHLEEVERRARGHMPPLMKEAAEKLGLTILPRLDETTTALLVRGVAQTHMFEAIDDAGLVGQLASMNYEVIPAPRGTDFWTTDNPVVLNPFSERKQRAELAWIALDPKRLLLLYSDNVDLDKARDAVPRAHNRAVVERPWRQPMWIFSSRQVVDGSFGLSKKDDLKPWMKECDKDHDARRERYEGRIGAKPSSDDT